jgi:hypothetical protein
LQRFVKLKVIKTDFILTAPGNRKAMAVGSGIARV